MEIFPVLGIFSYSLMRKRERERDDFSIVQNFMIYSHSDIFYIITNLKLYFIYNSGQNNLSPYNLFLFKCKSRPNGVCSPLDCSYLRPAFLTSFKRDLNTQ